MNPYMTQAYVATDPGAVGAPQFSTTSSSFQRSPQVPSTADEWIKTYGPQLCDYMERAGRKAAADGVVETVLPAEAKEALRTYPTPIPVEVVDYANDCFMKGYNEASGGGTSQDKQAGMSIGGAVLAVAVLGLGGLFVYNLARG